MAANVLIAVPDLLLQSRIVEAARRTGVAFQIADRGDEVLTMAKAMKPALIILDLESPRVQADKTLQRLGADAELAAIPTVGFYSHVDKRLADRMVQAGLGRAMPRGQFVEKLEELLQPLSGA